MPAGWSPRRLRQRGLLLVIFAGFVVAHLAAARGLYRAYPGSWSWTELLVDYQGGFVKRGLLGEVAYRVQGMVSPRHLVVDIIGGAYILASAGLILGLRLPEEFPGLLFLLSPAGWLFSLLNPAAYGRKDAFVVAALAGSMMIASGWRRRDVALLATMGIFALAGLLVEISWFYYPLAFAAFLARWREEPLRWRLGACAAAGTYTLACLLLTLRAPPVDTAAIAASWHHDPFYTDDTGALCCLNFGFASALSVAWATLPSLGGYAIAAAFGLLPLALLLARRPPVRVDKLTHAVALAGILAAMFPVFVTADWGRYIYLWLTATFLWAWTVSRATPVAADADAPASAYGLLTKGALIVVYASTWQVVHYQFIDRSALIPGALFRAVGASGERPVPD